MTLPAALVIVVVAYAALPDLAGAAALGLRLTAPTQPHLRIRVTASARAVARRG